MCVTTVPEHISLRPAGPADQELFNRVYAATRTDELAAVDWDDTAKETFLRMQFEAQHKYYTENYTGASFDVVVCDDGPCGRLYTVRWESEIRIMDIAVLPGFRNRGIGTRLLHDIIAEGEKLGLPVSIHVERFNPALRLYSRLGFECIEDKGVYLLLRRPLRPMPETNRQSMED
jgi:GNAT superfamily N-acetyltransferase